MNATIAIESKPADSGTFLNPHRIAARYRCATDAADNAMPAQNGSCKIRVIAGSCDIPFPRHARALPQNRRAPRTAQHPSIQTSKFANLLQSIQGIEFNLSTGERAFAAGIGTLFAAAALVAVLM